MVLESTQQYTEPRTVSFRYLNLNMTTHQPVEPENSVRDGIKIQPPFGLQSDSMVLERKKIHNTDNLINPIKHVSFFV